jgi:hypothetical protein
MPILHACLVYRSTATSFGYAVQLIFKYLDMTILRPHSAALRISEIWQYSGLLTDFSSEFRDA